jgi:hypothetical protein
MCYAHNLIHKYDDKYIHQKLKLLLMISFNMFIDRLNNFLLFVVFILFRYPHVLLPLFFLPFTIHLEGLPHKFHLPVDKHL